MHYEGMGQKIFKDKADCANFYTLRKMHSTIRQKEFFIFVGETKDKTEIARPLPVSFVLLHSRN